jgi:ribosomal protein S18 acetylase RimI-like enzyme
MIRIRPATPDDVNAVARVHVEAWHKAYDAHVPESMRDTVTLESRRLMWQVLLDRYAESHPTLVAETDAGEVVGFVMAGRAGDAYPGFDGEIHMLCVAPGYQRRDLGRRLFQAMIPVLRSFGCGSAVVSVLETPQALGFYAALGAQHLAATPLDVPDSTLKQHLFGWRDLARLQESFET